MFLEEAITQVLQTEGKWPAFYENFFLSYIHLKHMRAHSFMCKNFASNIVFNIKAVKRCIHWCI